MTPVLKSLDTEEHGPDDFTIKITISRDKIMEVTGADASQVPEKDFVQRWMRCTLDREAGTLRTQVFRTTESEPKTETEFRTTLNKAPLAFEGFVLKFDEDGKEVSRT